jgi:hypothetical protein
VRRVVLLCVSVAAILAGAGCAFHTPVPEIPEALAGDHAGPAHVRLAEVSVAGAAADEDVDEETVEAVRTETAEVLADAARTSTRGDGPTTMRVRVRLGEYVDGLERAMHQDGIAAVALVAVPMGITYEKQKVAVDVTVEHGGRTYEGHGDAEKAGGMYSSARRRALAVALDRALADAASHAR